MKEYIAAFSGDPENIMLPGQSVGAACILALMTMREADGEVNNSQQSLGRKL